ncbi:MAG: DNA-directed RNA polymerase subunit beta [bacterium]|nr:DNA-directed RNA polymerase subunit beta [bacterium]
MEKQKRISFGKVKEIIDIPPLIAIQKDSFEWFLQKDTSPNKRKPQGLQKVFLETFPITDFNNKVVLEFVEYDLGALKYNEEECRDRDVTYGIPLRVKLRLICRETGEIREQEVFMRDMPLMTERGTFIINGAERVIVSQLHRSPGVYFDYDSLSRLYSARIIPYRGAWLEFELDTNNILHARLGRKRKISGTALIRAIGYSTNQEIIDFFFPDQQRLAQIDSSLVGLRLAQEVINKNDNEVYRSGTRITNTLLNILKEQGIEELKVLDAEGSFILNTLEKDDTNSQNDALLKIHNIMRIGEPPNIENARQTFYRYFFDPQRYDLSEVGRYKINQKLELSISEEVMTLTPEDILETIKYLSKLIKKEGDVDDIDHLGNRRIRPVGELLQNQLRIGMTRLERSIRERMAIQEIETMTPQTVLNIKPVTAALNEFFGSNQLSQFMDQTNPLAELTHKRRLSALGQGGLSKERAGFEVRDVHYSHYGRICPIETPEGPNIGLIVSISVYGRLNHLGFIETPYRKVVKGRVSDQIEYLSADKEQRYVIAQASSKMDKKGNLTEDVVAARYQDDFPLVTADKVDYMDASLKQIISVGTSLIPFLEHDDANRALMGSNMQRQAVPLLICESPLVGTGIEQYIARDSGIVIIAPVDGIITRVSATEIILKGDDKKEYPYNLLIFKRSNQATCVHQKPIVTKGERVSKGQALTEGTATDNGELALGRNILVAFMPWQGYNFEDAILISEKLVRDDVFTSIHIEKYELEARDTQLGPEQITADIPNLGAEALKNLDDRGIIRLGARVKSGDILVGKVTPKGETELSPEYKLLHSIFGEKVREVRDTSLHHPYGSEGVVIDVKYFSSKAGDELPPGIEELVKVYVATKRKIMVGDKIAGRHGNKGVVAKILPEAEMPYLEDGTPVEMVLNSLSVPSRMNIGQILETHLGWAAHKLGIKVTCPVFDGSTETEIKEYLKSANLPEDGKSWLYDGQTGKRFNHKITVGYIYMMKLIHLVEDKIHARSIGPYSLVTQQPLGGKAQFGGQRLGEMEVWALEAYGATHVLQEFLTVKSDDIIGRAKVYEAIVKGENAQGPGVPESFNVLFYELRGLGLDVKVLDDKGKTIDIKRLNEDRRTPLPGIRQGGL